MTRYKLPDVLGGHEVELKQRAYNPNDVSVFLLRLPTESYPIHLHMMVVEEVDTTPAEPEPGAWLIGGVLCVRWEGDDCEDADYPWCSPLHSFTTFQAIWSRYGGSGITPRRLVPMPEPVELPWTGESALACRQIQVLVRGRLVSEYWGSGGVERDIAMMPDVAEAKAAALLAAARAAREVKP